MYPGLWVGTLTSAGSTPLRGRTAKPLRGFAAAAASVMWPRLGVEHDRYNNFRFLRDSGRLLP